MRKILKYRVEVDGLPVTIKGHITRLLDVQYQEDQGVMVWAETDDELKEIEIQIIGIGTGWPIPDAMKYWDYIGTVQENGYVWHYYAEPFHNPDSKQMLELASSFFGGMRGMEGHLPTISHTDIDRIVDEWNAVPERYYVRCDN